MPYVIRPGTVQATDTTDAGVQDVYHSPSVYVNNVPVALWDAPVQGDSVLSKMAIPPDPVVENYAPNPEQRTAYSARVRAATANPAPTISASGPDAGQTSYVVAPDAIATNTDDPNDIVGNPDSKDSPVALASGGSIWANLENLLNQCLQEGNNGGWTRKTSPNDIAPNYPFNANIMNCFLQMGFPKDKLDKTYRGPDPGQNGSGPGDRVAWCAAFAGTMLKAASSPYLAGNLSAAAYSEKWKQAVRVPVSDPTQWRRNDIVCLSPYGSGNHVGFLRGVDIKGDGVQLLGGNQGDMVKLSNFKGLSTVYFVGRAWTVDPAYDKPIIGPLTVQPKTKTR